MIDLHSHTFFSDGQFSPAEHIRRAEVAGYTGLAITDHADASNTKFLIKKISKAVEDSRKYNNIKVLCGVELTHVHPKSIADLTKMARDLGADIVSVHGETIVEPVSPGTNLAALEAGVDILCHPGLIFDDEAALAAEKGIHLEITTRRGHSLANGHVALQARKFGAKLVINTDCHAGEYLSLEMREKTARGCAMTDNELKMAIKNSEDILVSKF